MYSDWYVRHSAGKGLRLKKKETGHEVAGGAGSVSNMLPSISPRQYQVKKVDSIACIRFTGDWTHRHHRFLKRHYTLEEWKKAQWLRENRNQSGLGSFMEVSDQMKEEEA